MPKNNIVLTILLLFIIFLFIKSTIQKDYIRELKSKNKELVDSLNTIHQEEEIDSIMSELDKLYNVYDAFYVYNKQIDYCTIEKFIEVSTYFGLDKEEKVFDLCISQILLESGGKQRYQDGKLVVSSGSAIGLCQIVPTTAYHFLSKIDNPEKLYSLGASNFDFVNESGWPDLENRSKIIVWLSDETNNMVLWGYIMENLLKTNNNNIYKALAEYNSGKGGLNTFIDEGNSIHSHEYVKGVKHVSNIVDNS